MLTSRVSDPTACFSSSSSSLVLVLDPVVFSILFSNFLILIRSAAVSLSFFEDEDEDEDEDDFRHRWV